MAADKNTAIEDALEELILPFLLYEKSTPRKIVNKNLCRLREILESSGLHSSEIVSRDRLVQLRSSLEAWGDCRESDNPEEDCSDIEKLMSDIRKNARVILKMEFMKQPHLPIDTSSSTKEKSITSLSSSSSNEDSDSTSNELADYRKRRKCNQKGVSCAEMSKVHEKMAAKALRAERIPTEYFPYPMPLRYMCRRPELRWEWVEHKSRYRQNLIGGGANSDLENF